MGTKVSIVPGTLDWDSTDKGMGWIEVSARPVGTLQLFISSLCAVLWETYGDRAISLQNEVLRINYCRHDILKAKWNGIFRCDGCPVFGVEVSLDGTMFDKDGYQVFVWTDG